MADAGGDTRAGIESRITAALEAGDLQSAATAALTAYGSEILGYLISILRNPSDGNDVFSMFAEDLWNGLPAFRRESSFRTWAYKLAWHAAARFLDDPYRKRGRPLSSGELSHLADAVRTTTAAHVQTTVKDKMSRLRAALAPEEQTLLVLRIDRNLSWHDVSAVLSTDGAPLDEPALRKRFERLKNRLRQLARAEGLIPDG